MKKVNSFFCCQFVYLSVHSISFVSGGPAGAISGPGAGPGHVVAPNVSLPLGSDPTSNNSAQVSTPGQAPAQTATSLQQQQQQHMQNTLFGPGNNGETQISNANVSVFV